MTEPTPPRKKKKKPKKGSYRALMRAASGLGRKRVGSAEARRTHRRRLREEMPVCAPTKVAKI